MLRRAAAVALGAYGVGVGVELSAPLAAAARVPAAAAALEAARRGYAKGNKAKKGGNKAEAEAEEGGGAGGAGGAASSVEEVLAGADDAMAAAMDALAGRLGRVRTGRAAPGLVEHVTVKAYGDEALPLKALGTVTARDAQTLAVTLYDPSTADAVAAAIGSADLGLQARAEGDAVVVPVPPPTKDGLKAFAKVVAEAGEQAKVSVRRARKDALDALKKAGLPEDEQRRAEKAVQAVTDDATKTIAAAVDAKEKELTAAKG